MDIHEKKGKNFKRHPWELARTDAVLSDMKPYIKKSMYDGTFKYINVGAGDGYYDKVLIKRLGGTALLIDKDYPNLESKFEGIEKKYLFDESITETFDFAIMMDSLEYMTDDVEFLRKLSQNVKAGGYIFLTLPAFPVLFGDYDVNIGNLRRYTIDDVNKMVSKTGTLKMEKAHYFFFSLFLVRAFQTLFRIKIDPRHKFTTAWKYGEKHPCTVLTRGVLRMDYGLGGLLGSFLPGLSLYAVLKKVK